MNQGYKTSGLRKRLIIRSTRLPVREGTYGEWTPMEREDLPNLRALGFEDNELKVSIQKGGV